MISVPDSIKEKLHLDHCQKNIRIHFPNGERSDICNDLIVKDTVNFTESLCSQDSLKFGLCEAPIFECETVGVGNIKGAEIEVFCEVYCDQSVPGSEWRTDLQHNIYSIQYGSFIVSECKRQADMIHRRIVAYGGQASRDWTPIDFEKRKVCRSTSYNPFIGFFLASNDFDIINECVDEVVQPWSQSGLTIPLSFSGQSAEYNARIEFIDTYLLSWAKWNTSTYGYTSCADVDKDKMFRVSANFLYNAEMKNEIDDLFAPYIENMRKSDLDNVQLALKNGGYIVMSDKASGWGSYARQFVNKSRTNIYPYAENFYRSNELEGQTRYYLAKQATVEIYKVEHSSRVVVASKTFTLLDGDAVLYKRTLKQDFAFLGSLQVNIPAPTRDSAASGFGCVWYVEDYTDIDIQGLANAYSELLGCFAYIKNNIVNSVNIKRQFGLIPQSDLYPSSNLYPGAVTGGKLLPQDYQSCWYDDDYTMPYGAITCTFKNTNNEDVSLVFYLPGYSEDSDVDSYKTYDITQNAIIQAYSWTQTQIETICQVIADNISGVTYMPVEFVGRGLPYVEAGDTFEILTKSNDSITTIVLNRTLTGEQTLTDTYKSV